jgi:putative SOS response-associated peptidase YedK
MCGRFSLYEPTSRLVERFSIDEVVGEEPPPRWNVAPTQPVLVVATSRDGATRRLGTMRWGLIPSWSKDPSIGSRFINARAETLSTTRAFSGALQTRRCLIPASGFYEWQKLEDIAGKRRPSRPFYLHPVDDMPLAIAGLWEVWHDPAGGTLRSCTIITTAANSAVSPVHNRMPAILGPNAWDRWLAPQPLDDDERASLLVPAPDGLLSLDPVATLVNSPQNDSPELIEPVSPGQTTADGAP